MGEGGRVGEGGGWEEEWEGEKVNLLLKKTRKLGIFHDVFVHIVNSPLLIITLRRYMDTSIMMYVYVCGRERGV